MNFKRSFPEMGNRQVVDSGLDEKLKEAREQVDRLFRIEEAYLTMKAAKDSQWGVLYISTIGQTVKDREAAVNASPGWKSFSKSLAEAEAAYHKEKYILELKFKECDAAHLSLKVERMSIERGVQ